MDPKYRDLLKKQYEAITKDLDVSDIQDRLYENNYFTDEEYEKINATSKANRIERTRELLTSLMQKGSNTKYEIFVDSLAKEYDWLWMKFKVDDTEAEMTESFEDILNKGDVPRPPDHLVRRETLETLLVDKLRKLTRHKIIALHGMSGSGKTCLAISALRNNPLLITDSFKGHVFWLNLGTCKTADDVIAQQAKLLNKTTSIYRHSLYMSTSISMSSIASNGDSLSVSTVDMSSEDLKDQLKIQFSEEPLKEALLVLDEVNDKEFLRTFDVGCKILATTRDSDVVVNSETQIIEIENSLKKQESLKVFASFLGEDNVNNLPRQAKKLHDACKGNPFHIALIGAQLAENRERLKDYPKLWNYFVTKLEKKEFFTLFSRSNDNPMKTIEMCINSLKDNVLALYKKLAILPDNVKVSTQVLSKLWNSNVTDVKSIMQDLKKKSLIIETYDKEIKNYMYEVHDLLMNYIRSCLPDEEKRKLHNHLLNSYNYDSTVVPVDIVDDRYIAYYVGYHIYHTNNYNNKWDLFKKLYLDLKFLGNKTRLTGPADVIHDLQMYEDRIVSDEVELNLLQSIKAFLMTHGADLYRYQGTDIIQSVLQHESKGILYCKASEIAHDNALNNELYFDFLHEDDVDEIKHSTIDVSEVITCVCFLWDYVLVGTHDGAVKIFHNPTNKLHKEYIATDASKGFPVKWLGVAVTKTYPVISALYTNGTIKLWNIDDLDQSDTEGIIEEEPEEIHNNNVPCNITITPDIGTILNLRWSANEEYLLAHTKHEVIVYNLSGEVRMMIDQFDTSSYIVGCVPFNNDTYIIAISMLGIKQRLEIIELSTKKRVTKSIDGDAATDAVKDILTVFGTNKLLTLSSSEVVQYKITISDNITSMESKMVLNARIIKPNLSFLSFAVNKSATLMFVSTNDGRVLCVDLRTNTHVFDLENKRGNVVTMAVSEMVMWDEFEAGYDVLLTGSGELECTAKVWHLDTAFISQAATRNGRVRLTKKFDVSFLTNGTPLTPNTPSNKVSTTVTPKRHQSFNNPKDVAKRVLSNTLSLDRLMLKPLNLKGIGCSSNEWNGRLPLLAVIDDENNIQVMRGRKVLTKITDDDDDPITTVRITPCNQHIVYGQKSGLVKRYTIRTKETKTIMHVYSTIQYMGFVNPDLMIAAGENRCIIAYKLLDSGQWNTIMMQHGNTYLGSQEILNDIQGVKKKQSDNTSNASHDSLEHRTFTNERRSLCKGSDLVECFSITNVGVITVESSGCVKLWDKDLKLACVLNGRRDNAKIVCAAFKGNVLVICDSVSSAFQTFRLSCDPAVSLEAVQEQQLNSVVTCCDLTADGRLLALGLQSGNVLVWNVKTRRQLSHGLLRHHKHVVRSCSFSPIPDALYRSSPHNSTPLPAPDEQPPLVLVTMATEIVFWNISYMVKKGRVRQIANALTPLGSPHDSRTDPANGSKANTNQNFFFSEGLINHNCWKDLWKGKTYKRGSKRKDILACIKLSGVHANTLRHDECFSSFVTVDNTGYVHIMNVLKAS